MADTTTTDPQSTAGFDFFLSYRRCDAARVQPLVDALRTRGLRVWQDVEEIDTFESIQRAIQTGLAQARALLVWYSATYNDSRACQWELTSAYLAAQTDPATAGDPRCRILVVNPEAGATHVVLPALFDQRHLKAAESDIVALADRIADHLVRNVPATPLGHLRALVLPRMLPHGLLGSTRFVGRLKWMWQLHATLQAGEAAMLTGIGGSGQSGLVQVRGTGGIGKSLLAEEYALRFGAAYPGGIFWLRAEGYTDRDEPISATARLDRLEGQIIGFVQQLELPISGLSPLQVKGVFAGYLRRQGQPFLWIVDDLPADPGPAGLGSWLAPDPLGRTLITTRARRFNHVSLIELPQLDEAEALQLISRGGPLDDANCATALAICSELGHHALAVDVAAALIEQRGYAKFLDRLRRDSTNPDVLEIAAALDESLPNGHQRSIAATLLASIDELDEPALDVLRLAALLADAPIPRDLIWRSIAQADTLDADDAQDRCDPAISRTVAASLADKVEGGIAVHTLVSRTVLLHKQDEARAEPLLAAAVAVLNQEMSRAVDIREHDNLKDWVPHARHMGATQNDMDAVMLINWVAWHDYERGQYTLARTGWEMQFMVSQRMLGEEHPWALTTMNNLAVTHKSQGDLRGARALQDAVLQIQYRVLGQEHPSTLVSMNNLAGTLLAQGDLLGAHQLQSTVFQIQRCTLGDEHPGTLTSMNNLAMIFHAKGELNIARQLQSTVLPIQGRVLGEAHPRTLTSMNNLASILQAQGDLRGARQLQDTVVHIRQCVLGEEHPDTLISLSNLAGTLLAQGDFLGAHRLQDTVLEIRLRVLGEAHPDTLMSMSNLAEILLAQGDLCGALQRYSTVLRFRRYMLGQDHPDTLASMSGLARTVHAQGDLLGARHLQDIVMQIRRRTLGDEHPDTLRSMSSFAGIIQDQGDLLGAGQLQGIILQIQRRMLGEAHPDTLASLNNLAVTLQAQGNIYAACELQDNVVQILRRELGEEHPDTLTSMSNLAVTLQSLGDLSGARQLQEIALPIQRRVLGEKHCDTTRSAWNLFYTLQKLDAFDEASKLRAELLDWLLTCSQDSLSGQQRQILQLLRGQPAPKMLLTLKY